MSLAPDGRPWHAIQAEGAMLDAYIRHNETLRGELTLMRYALAVAVQAAGGRVVVSDVLTVTAGPPPHVLAIHRDEATQSWVLVSNPEQSPAPRD